MNFELQGSTVLITGGTGTFGRAFLRECLGAGAGEMRIFSRDEKKQFDMAQIYRGNRKVRFFLGDVRDKFSVDAAMGGVDFVFHAAAMKQIPFCERFPMEAMKTNVMGSENVLRSAIEHRARKVVCLSTDKAVYPTSTMGMTKAFMEKLARQAAARQGATEICLTRFGNLIASRGSAVPLFLKQARSGRPITITHPDMTRFVMTVEEATALVRQAFATGRNGELLVKRSAACSTGDLVAAVCRYTGLTGNYPVERTGLRPGERMHEALLTGEEAGRAVERDDCWVFSEDLPVDGGGIGEGYRSEMAERLDQDALVRLIESVFQHGGEGRDADMPARESDW